MINKKSVVAEQPKPSAAKGQKGAQTYLLILVSWLGVNWFDRGGGAIREQLSPCVWNCPNFPSARSNLNGFQSKHGRLDAATTFVGQPYGTIKKFLQNIFAAMLLPDCGHLISVAPSLSRAKSHVMCSVFVSFPGLFNAASQCTSTAWTGAVVLLCGQPRRPARRISSRAGARRFLTIFSDTTGRTILRRRERRSASGLYATHRRCLAGPICPAARCRPDADASASGRAPKPIGRARPNGRK